MDPLPLIITEAGRAAIVDAEGGGISAVRITQVGLTNTIFAAEEGIAELPGETKRLNAVSGTPTDPHTIHMTARDSSADEYEFTGYGVYLDDGTLFAVYSQEEGEGPVAGKAAPAMLYLAFDIELSAAVAELFEFGDANFLNPLATEQTPGVARIATLEEVEEGADPDKIVTPQLLKAVYVALEMLGVPQGVATLDADGKLAVDQRPPVDLIDVFAVPNQAAMLALAATPGDFAVRADVEQVFILQQLPATTLANWLEINTPAPVLSVNGKAGTVVLVPGDIGAVPSARTISTTGLATGGGHLGADRTINVPVASPEETAAGDISNKAVVPSGLAFLLEAIGAGVPASRKITGSGLATGGGTFAADRQINVAIASAADALAGVLNDRAVTPASLVTILAQIAGRVPAARRVLVSGLATGGGNLEADRTISVPAATAAEVLGLSIANKAVTPASLSNLVASILADLAALVTVTGSGSTMVIKIGRVIIQIFAGTALSDTPTTLSLPQAFPTRHVAAWVNGGKVDSGQNENGPFVSARSNTTVTLYNGINQTVPVQVIAIGE